MVRSALRLFWPSGLLLVGSALLWFVLYGMGQSGSEATGALLLFGEALLPPLAGCFAAQIWLGDAYREVLMSYPIAAWRLLGGRLLVLWLALALGWGGLVGLSMATLAPVPGEADPQWLRILVSGLATQSLGLAFGSTLALMFGGAASACLAVVALWGLAIAFRSAMAASAPLAVVHPLLGYQDLSHSLWALNRIVLGGLALVLLAGGFWLVGRSERFLPSRVQDEG